MLDVHHTSFVTELIPHFLHNHISLLHKLLLGVILTLVVTSVSPHGVLCPLPRPSYVEYVSYLFTRKEMCFQ